MPERKTWEKFGDAKRYKPGDESMTAVSLEEIFLEKVRLQPKSEVEKAADPLSAMASAQSVVVGVQNVRKEGRSLDVQVSVQGFSERWKQTAGGRRRTGTEKAGWIRAAVHAGGRHRYGGVDGSSPGRKLDSRLQLVRRHERARFARVVQTVRSCHAYLRRYQPRDWGGRGFAFVNMVSREDGQRAIDKLDGYGYDSLILRVEWAAPREERPR